MQLDFYGDLTDNLLRVFMRFESSGTETCVMNVDSSCELDHREEMIRISLHKGAQVLYEAPAA